jgi:type IV pilus assembly protein PilE
MTRRPPADSRGVTLIELLAVALVLAVLLALAVPGYRGHAARAERTDARAMLLRIAADQEAYFIRTGTYARSLQLLGFGSARPTTGNGRYQLWVRTADVDHFIVRATYLPTDAESRLCGWFEIDEQLARHSSPAGPEVCWDR